MNKKILLSLFAGILWMHTGFAQRMSAQQYIEKYKADAIRDMHRSGVPASITMAQALLESDCGNSPLSKGSNNHFGIKCHKEWNGPGYYHDDDAKQECFRKYPSVLDSYDDHSRFLKTRPRYASLFLLDRTDYKEWARGLKKAGYATNPRYAEMLIRLIEENRLYELDRIEDSSSPETQQLIASAAVKEPVKKSVPSPTPSKAAPAPDVYVDPHPVRIFTTNDVQYVIARQGDSYLKLANEFELGLWQILKYNEIDRSLPLIPGQRIYLEPKKRKAEAGQHVVKAGETLHSISQQYAIKTKHLRRLNSLASDELKPGQVLMLN
jgi:LysM repeat protein